MTLATVVVVAPLEVCGAGGLRAALALELFGHRVCELPTMLVPGWGGAGGHAVADAVFADLAGAIEAAPWLGSVGAVITGRFASPAQVARAVALIEAVRAVNPAALIVADPSIGGADGLDAPEAVAVAVRDLLVPSADLATPNRGELGWLTGRPTEDLTTLAAAARALGSRRVAVTSVPPMMAGKIATALVAGDDMLLAETTRLPRAPRAAGDLFAAVLTGHLLAGASDGHALASSVASVFEVIARSAHAGSDALELAAEQTAIVRSNAMVDIRHFGGGVRRRPVARPSQLGGA